VAREWPQCDHLAKEPALRVVLMLLGKGTRISEHQAAGPLTFQLLSGSVTFRAGDRAERLASGDLIVLESEASMRTSSAMLLSA
jgi:quercetin dioxygenase-like cupin family protein